MLCLEYRNAYYVQSNFVGCKATTFVSFRMRYGMQGVFTITPFSFPAPRLVIGESSMSQRQSRNTWSALVWPSRRGSVPFWQWPARWLSRWDGGWWLHHWGEMSLFSQNQDQPALDEVTGLLKLKQTPNHWHQIQGNLHLTGANNCHLVVWTPLDLVILLIPKDPAWASNINILETFYKDCFLPRILLHSWPVLVHDFILLQLAGPPRYLSFCFVVHSHHTVHNTLHIVRCHLHWYT